MMAKELTGTDVFVVISAEGCETRASATEEVVTMPKYLVQASYIGDGVQGLRKEGGTARRAVVEKACSSVGGKLDAFYFAFGETDVVTIMDLPDNVTAAGVALLVAASGTVGVKTTVLLTPEEVDAAVKVGGDYRPPGG